MNYKVTVKNEDPYNVAKHYLEKRFSKINSHENVEQDNELIMNSVKFQMKRCKK